MYITYEEISFFMEKFDHEKIKSFIYLFISVALLVNRRQYFVFTILITQ